MVSGGPDDFKAMQHVSAEWCDGEPDTTVSVNVSGEPYSYRVWLHKSKPKIMVQTASMAGVAAAGFVRGVTAGLVKGEQEYEPMKEAALLHLTSTFGPGCTVQISQKIARVGWEWDYVCPSRKR